MPRTNTGLKKYVLFFLIVVLVGGSGWLAYATWTVVEHNHLNDALIQAVKIGDVIQVQKLLNQGADANARDIPPTTPHGFLDWIRLLLHGSTSDPHALTAILVSIKADPEQASSLRIIPLLAAHGADFNARDHSGNTALICVAGYPPDHYLTAELGEHLAKLLMEEGADINATNNYGETALCKAVDSGLPAVANALLDRGADVDVQDKAYGATILELGLGRCLPGDYRDDLDKNVDLFPLIKRLVDRSDNLKRQDSDGNTLLHHAAEVQDSRYLRLLMERGLDVNTPNLKGETPIMNAIMYSCADNIKLLGAQEADLNAKDNSGYTVLDVALAYSDVHSGSTIRWLESKGARSSWLKNKEARESK